QLRDKLAQPNRQIHFRQWQVPRAEYLSRLRQARVTVCLPHAAEGFYLPALEGMALGTVVVCPDFIGNPSFCLHGDNCFRPDPTLDAIAAAAETALALSPTARRAILDRARQTALDHDLAHERRAFLNLLRNVHQLW